MIRYAVVANARDVEQIDALLPSNYEVVGRRGYVDESDGKRRWIIRGEDAAGWTLDGYVIPRLASALVFATERVFADNCPDCKQGTVTTSSECSVCGLSWEDVAAAAEKWKEVTEDAAA